MTSNHNPYLIRPSLRRAWIVQYIRYYGPVHIADKRFVDEYVYYTNAWVTEERSPLADLVPQLGRDLSWMYNERILERFPLFVDKILRYPTLPRHTLIYGVPDEDTP